jgi:hypothetical protein
VKGFKKCCMSIAVDGREDEEEVENVGSESDEVRTVKTLRPTGETG